MRIGVLEESVKSFELECKSGSETTARLTAELERERRKVASSSAALDSLKLVTAPQQIRGKLHLKKMSRDSCPVKVLSKSFKLTMTVKRFGCFL